MKTNEIISEGPISAAIKGAFTGRGTQQQLTLDIFLKDFYQDAITSLNTAIKGGYVNPELRTNSADIIQKSPPKKPRGSNSLTPGPNNGPANDSQQQNIVTEPNNPWIKLFSWGSKEFDKLKSQGYNDDDARTSVLRQIGPTEGLDARDFKRIGKQTDPKWQELANQFDIYIAKQVGQSNTPQTSEPIGEYNKMNRVFETIVETITLAEAPESLPTAKSIAQYIMIWFNAYMRGVNWESDKDHVQALARQIENTYSKDRGKAAIKQLAQTAFAISKTSGTVPKGAKNATTNNIQQKSSKTGSFLHGLTGGALGNHQQSTQSNLHSSKPMSQTAMSDKDIALWMKANPEKAKELFKSVRK